MNERYLTVVYRLPEGASAASLLANPQAIASSWQHALAEPPTRKDRLQELVDEQLCTIKALVHGCEKYGLTETTPVLRRLGALEQDLQGTNQRCKRLERDARFATIAFRFVDRAGDTHPGIDEAQTICDEFHAAMLAQLQADIANPPPA